VKAREYAVEKEALKAAEEQAKLDRKIKRAANALRKKQEEAEKAKKKEEKDAKAAQKQLVKDLATANKLAKKTLKEQPIGTVTKAKKSAPTVQKERKVSTKARPRGKPPVNNAAVVLVEGVVVLGVAITRTATRKINLPPRYRDEN
jgi:hypothetical protein